MGADRRRPEVPAAGGATAEVTYWVLVEDACDEDRGSRRRGWPTGDLDENNLYPSGYSIYISINPQGSVRALRRLLSPDPFTARVSQHRGAAPRGFPVTDGGIYPGSSMPTRGTKFKTAIGSAERACNVPDPPPGTGELAALRMAPMQARNLRLNRAAAADMQWLRTALERSSRRFGSLIDLRPDGLLALRPGAS